MLNILRRSRKPARFSYKKVKNYYLCTILHLHPLKRNVLRDVKEQNGRLINLLYKTFKNVKLIKKSYMRTVNFLKSTGLGVNVGCDEDFCRGIFG